MMRDQVSETKTITPKGFEATRFELQDDHSIQGREPSDSTARLADIKSILSFNGLKSIPTNPNQQFSVIHKFKTLSLPDLEPLADLNRKLTSNLVRSDRQLLSFARDAECLVEIDNEHKVDPKIELEVTKSISEWWISQEAKLNATANHIMSLYGPGDIDYGHHLGLYVEAQVYPYVHNQCPQMAHHIIQVVRANASYYIAFRLWKHLELQIQEAYIECSHDRDRWFRLLDVKCEVWKETYHPFVGEILHHLVAKQVEKLPIGRQVSIQETLLLPHNPLFRDEYVPTRHFSNDILEAVDPIDANHRTELLRLYLKIQVTGPLPYVSIPQQFDPSQVIMGLLNSYASSIEVASYYDKVTSKDHAINLVRHQPGLCIDCGSVEKPIYCNHPSATVSYFDARVYFRCWSADKPRVLLDLSPKLTVEERSLSKRRKERELRQKLKDTRSDEWDSYSLASKYSPIPDYNLSSSIVSLKRQWQDIHCRDPEFSRQFLQESDFHIFHPILAIHSGMNTGKTAQLIVYIKRLLLEGQISRFLYLSPRCSFANSVCQRLVEAGIPIKNYLDCLSKDNINDHDFVMVSTESMYKAASRDRDLVIIDEVDTVLFQMLSPHHRDNLKTNQKVFETHIKHAKRLIVLDANITTTTLTFLQRLRPRETIELVRNAYQPRQGWTAGVYKETAWLSQIKDAVARNENIAIVTSSEGYGETKLLTLLMDREKGCGLLRRQIGWYHGSGDDLKDELKNVNSTWTQYRVVMYTSTINVGIDFNVPHFHSIFVYGNSQSVCVEEMRQMMGRVRSTHGNNNRIYCFIRDTRGSYMLERDQIKAFIIRAHEAADEDTTLDNLVTIRDPDVEERTKVVAGNTLSVIKRATTVEVAYKHGFVLEETCWNDLAVDYFLRINRSKAQYTERFINMLEDQGITVTDCRDEDISQSERQIGHESSKLSACAQQDQKDYFTRLVREPNPTPEMRRDLEARIKNAEAKSIDHDRDLVWRWRGRIAEEHWCNITGDMVEGNTKLTPQQLARIQVIKSKDSRVGWHSYRRKAEKSVIVGQHDELLLRANQAVCRILEISSLTHYSQQELEAFRAERWDLKEIDPIRAKLGEMEAKLEYMRFEQEGWPPIAQLGDSDDSRSRRSFLNFDNRVIKDKIKDWTDAYILLNASADLGLSCPRNLQSVTRLVKDWLSSVYGVQWQQIVIQPRVDGKQVQRSYRYLCTGHGFKVYNWLKPTNIPVDDPRVHLRTSMPNLPQYLCAGPPVAHNYQPR